MSEEPIVVTVVDDVIFVAGEIDLCSAQRLDAALTVNSHLALVDMAGVSFMDSSGLNVLLSQRRRRLSQGGTLLIIAMSRAVERILEMSGLTPTFRW